MGVMWLGGKGAGLFFLEIIVLLVEGVGDTLGLALGASSSEERSLPNGLRLELN